MQLQGMDWYTRLPAAHLCPALAEMPVRSTPKVTRTLKIQHNVWRIYAVPRDKERISDIHVSIKRQYSPGRACSKDGKLDMRYTLVTIPKVDI